MDKKDEKKDENKDEGGDGSGDEGGDEGGRDGAGRGRGKGSGKREKESWKLLTGTGPPKLGAVDENRVSVFDATPRPLPPPLPLFLPNILPPLPPPPPPPPPRSPNLGNIIPNGLILYGSCLIPQILYGIVAFHDKLKELARGEDGTESMGVGVDTRGVPRFICTFPIANGKCTPESVRAVLDLILSLFHYPITPYSYIPDSLGMTLIYVTLGSNFSYQQIAEMADDIYAMNGLVQIGIVDDQTTHVVDVFGASSSVLEGRRRGRFIGVVIPRLISDLRSVQHDFPYTHGAHTWRRYAMPLAYHCKFVIAASVGPFALYVRRSLRGLGAYEIPSRRMSEAQIAVCMSSADPEFAMALKCYVVITVSPGWAVLCRLDMAFHPPEQFRVRDPSVDAQLEQRAELDRIRRIIDSKNSQSPFGHIGDTRRRIGDGRTSRAEFSAPPGFSGSSRSNPAELEDQLARLSLTTPAPEQPPRPPEPVLGGRPRTRPFPRTSRDLHSFAPHPVFSRANQNYDPYRQQQPPPLPPFNPLPPQPPPRPPFNPLPPQPPPRPPFNPLPSQPPPLPPFNPLPPQTSQHFDRFLDNSVAHVASYLAEQIDAAQANNTRDNNHSHRLNNMTRTTSLLGNYSAQFTRPNQQHGDQRQGQSKKSNSNFTFPPQAENKRTRRRANSHPNSPQKKNRDRRSSGSGDFNDDDNDSEPKPRSPSPKLGGDNNDSEPKPKPPSKDKENRNRKSP